MSPTKVHCIFTTTVRSANHTESTGRVHLTPWDIKVLPLHYTQRGLLFLRPQTQQQESIPISHLISSLSSTLNYFVPLTGRLAIETHEDNNTISFYIDCNGAGAEFIHATIDLRVSDILDPTDVPHIVHSFFPLNGVINYEGISQPLLALQVTELVDGIFIGCSMNHMVCDGRSFWHFINCWSEIARATTSHHTVACPPSLKRWFPKDSDCPICIPSSLLDKSVEERHSPPLLVQRVFNFTRESIAKLKHKANIEQKTDKISSLQALLGYVWIAMTRARCVDSNQEVICRIVAGNRARLNPPLPDEYFGNSAAAAIATAKAGELLDKGLGSAAWLLNQAVSGLNEAEIRTSWENWVKEPFLLSMSNMNANVMSCWSSPRFNVYGNDFGWGPPVAMRNGYANRFDGRVVVHSGAVEGSVDVEVCLSPLTLRAMGDDSGFMEDVNFIN